mmetsp:Transcript_10300/g.14777  ORF Transcript_10300/g.14777 Transcript_10300/m.14777 type:complete len:292 (+) Transcript_10300:48-923(+)
MPIATPALQQQTAQQALLLHIGNVERIPSSEIDTRDNHHDNSRAMGDGGGPMKKIKKHDYTNVTAPNATKTSSLPRTGERRVSFSPRVRARPSLHINEYTEEEHFNSWYRPEEYQSIKKNIVLTVKLAKRGLLYNEDDSSNDNEISPPSMTMRGLEHRTRTGHLVRETNKAGALLTVLNEQLKQRKSGQSDDEAIRQVYLQVSYHCLKKAQDVGRQDYDEILEEDQLGFDDSDFDLLATTTFDAAAASVFREMSLKDELSSSSSAGTSNDNTRSKSAKFMRKRLTGTREKK